MGRRTGLSKYTVEALVEQRRGAQRVPAAWCVHDQLQHHVHLVNGQHGQRYARQSMPRMPPCLLAPRRRRLEFLPCCRLPCSCKGNGNTRGCGGSTSRTSTEWQNSALSALIITVTARWPRGCPVKPPSSSSAPHLDPSWRICGHDPSFMACHAACG